VSDPADDPLFHHDAQQAAQDAAEHVAASIQDAAEVQALFVAARVRFLSVEPQSDGSVRVASDVPFSTSALNRLYAAMGASENWNGGAFTVMHSSDGKGGYAWVLTRRTG
jgi:hypothetical protein